MSSRRWLAPVGLAMLAGLAGCHIVWRLDDLRDPGSDAQVSGDTNTGGDVGGDGPAPDPRIRARFDFEDSLQETTSGQLAACAAGGCPTFVTGVHGKAIKLDGLNDCVEFPLPGSVDRVTVVAWINKASDTGQSVVSKPFGSTISDSYQIDIESNRNVRFITYDGNADDVLVAPSSITLNVWQHVAVTFDGAKRIFINGSPAPAMSGTAPLLTDGSPLLIGCDDEGALNSRFFNGMIDEVIIYNAALGASEISALANP